MRIETWDRTSLREQEDLVGRTKGEGAPLSGGTEFTEPDFAAEGGDGMPLIAVDSHVRLAHPSSNDGARMLRRGYNFTDGNDGARPARRGAVLPRVRHGPAHALHPDAVGAVARRRADGVPHAHRRPGSSRCRPGVPDGSLVLGADGTPVTTDDSPYVGQALFA